MRHDILRFSLVFAALIAFLLLGPASDGFAVEGGQGHYPLGFMGWQAGLVPPEPGTYFKNYMRFYDGNAAAEVRGGQIALDLDQSTLHKILSFTRVTDLKVLGGDVFATAFIPFTNANVSGTAEFKYFREFAVQNRFEGNTYWFNLSYAF